jgi:hypothetical protein
MGANNRVDIGLSYRPARLHRLAESIPGLLMCLKIRTLEAGGVTPPHTLYPSIPMNISFKDDVTVIILFGAHCPYMQ